VTRIFISSKVLKPFKHRKNLGLFNHKNVTNPYKEKNVSEVKLLEGRSKDRNQKSLASYRRQDSISESSAVLLTILSSFLSTLVSQLLPPLSRSFFSPLSPSYFSSSHSFSSSSNTNQMLNLGHGANCHCRGAALIWPVQTPNVI